MGLRSARSRPALAEMLRKERLLLKRAYQMPLVSAPADQLLLKDQAIMNEQLGQLLSRGVPLIEALEVAAQTVSPSARSRIDKMREMVQAGSSFSDAARGGGGLDAVTCAIYRAAERTGDLAGAAKQLAITARRTLLVAGKAGTLMVYPAIVLGISLVVATIMIIFIVPKLGDQLKSMGQTIPWYTRVLIWLGDTLSDNLGIFLGVVMIAMVVIVVIRKSIRMWGLALLRNSPLIKQVVMAQEAAKFFAVMAAMTRSGVPLADGLATANQAISHPLLRTQMERLRTRLVEGGVLRLLIEQVDALPLATRKLLVAAERSGDMESAFNSLAQDMTDEVDRRSSRVLAFLQPALIVVMFLIIGSILLAILVPLLTMGSSLGKK